MARKHIYTVIIVLIAVALYAQKGSRNRHLEIFPQTSPAAVASIEAYPSSLYNLSFRSQATSPEETALRFLEEEGYRLGISDVPNTLQYKTTRSLPSGYRVRFSQVYQGYPVYKSGVVVSINDQNEVVFVANSYKPNVKISQKILAGSDQALQIAKNHLAINSDVNNLKSGLVIFYNNGISRLVQKVSFIPRAKNIGDWEFLIDAETSEIIQARDQGFYQSGNNLANVFDPDPITRSDADYEDSGYVDDDDQDSPELTQQLVDKELLNLSFQGDLYRLKNEYASIIDTELPNTGLHSQDSANFFFTRSHDAFEAVNVFYHINRSMSYINDTLGIELMPFQYQGGVRFDPHGLDREDQSWYVPSAGYVAFGDGGVDDAEDQDVIIHELGHGIHDWITDGELSQVDGLSEGCGDYWAQSYKRSLGFMDEAHPKYNWLFSWDGHNDFWAGRQTDYEAKYPDGLVNQIHTDGQIWATALMKIHDLIGREVTDINFLSGLSMLNDNSSQRDAAYAFIQADIDNYEGQHLPQIIEVFYNTGYINNVLSVAVKADITGGPANLTVNFSDVIGSHSSWQWDFDGDGITDSEERNPSYTYTEAGLYTVKLSFFDGVNMVSDSLLDFISVNDGLFVWEGIKNGRDNSGKFIYDFLEQHNLPVVYSRSPSLPTSLIGYDAVFLCFGSGTNSVIFDDQMVASVQSYLQNGGKVYIEGADVAASQSDNEQLLDLLGLSLVLDGSPTGASLSALNGQAGSIFTDLQFSNSLQQEQVSIDKYVANENGRVAFIESDYGNVAVENEGNYNQKSLIFSYALAEIIDAMIPNTREDLLINILEFMEIDLPVAVRFSAQKTSGHKPFTVNFLNYSVFDEADPEIQWQWDFDNDGIYDSEEVQPFFTYEDSGLYDVKLTLSNDQDSITTLLPGFIRVFDGESALHFDDEENNIQFEAHADFNLTNEFTIEFWMYPEGWGMSSDGFGRIFDKENIQLFLRKTGNTQFNAHSLVIFMIHEGQRISSYCTPDSSVKLNQWQHIAIAYNGVNSTLTAYINGQQVNLDIVTIGANGPVADNADINLVLAESLLGSFSYSGKLDEFRLWNVARSSFKIQTDWNRYIEPDQLGLLAYWNFNEAFGDTMLDLSANGNKGVILNPQWVQGKPDLLPTDILGKNEKILVDFRLYSNYPNPFNPQTDIKFQIPHNSDVDLTIYDILGRKIKTLVQSKLNKGAHSSMWNGQNDLNHQVASGIYFYVLTAKTADGIIFTDQKKMILIH